MSRKIRSIVLILAVLAFPGTLWRWLADNAPGLAFFWDKAGSEMDPNGAKAGVEMDPNGRTTPRLTTDAGPDMDPNG
jgi:hypothetical protein